MKTLTPKPTLVLIQPKSKTEYLVGRYQGRQQIAVASMNYDLFTKEQIPGIIEHFRTNGLDN